MKEESENFFFFGSNMCIPFLKSMGVKVLSFQKAVLHQHRLRINVPDWDGNFGFANIEEDSNSNVEGLLMKIPAKAVKILDEYENYPEDYLVKKHEVLLAEQKIVKAKMYYGNPKVCCKKDLMLNSEQQERIQWAFPYLSPIAQKKYLRFFSAL